MVDETTARDFAEYMKRFPDLYDHLAGIVHKYLSKPHPVILDLGAGPGLLSAAMLRVMNDATMIALDPLQVMLELAQKNAVVNTQNQFGGVRGVSEKLPFKKESFDCIVSRFSLPYWPQPAQSFLEMHRVLKPGGTVVLEALNYRFPKVLLWAVGLQMRGRGATKEVTRYHLDAYPCSHTREEVRKFFLDAGFEVSLEEGKNREWRFIMVGRKP